MGFLDVVEPKLWEMGKRRGGGRMLDAVSLLLLLLGCCCCVWPQKQILVVADTDPNDVTALNTLFNSLNSPGQLKGWQANGGDPCGHSWQGITCSGSSVTAIKLPSLGLSMNLGYNMNTMNSLVEIDMSQNNLGGGQAIQYKRLNDCLSMLRSVLPKISKMDRTSILGDTIDYMKELLERIRQLQEEIDQQQETPAVLNVFRELNPNDMLARNTPKFEVERKEGGDTWVEIYFAARLGLLLSTVSTLEMLGLDIQ